MSRAKRLAGWVLCGVLATSCGGDDASSNEDPGDATQAPTGGANTTSSTSNKSGSRLKLTYISSADGARLFGGFYDSQLQLSCSPGRMRDEVLRCLPLSYPADFGVTYGDYFSDAQCTKRTRSIPEDDWISQPSCGAAKTPYRFFFATAGFTACDGTRPFDIWEVAEANQVVYGKNSSGACVALPGRRRLDLVSPATFVELTEGQTE